jgi:hypothetical protein
MATPLLLLVHDRLIASGYAAEKKRPADQMESNEDHVIIAGLRPLRPDRRPPAACEQAST